MSKRCCNSEIGTLIHAYELNQLTEVETHLFEDHLLECEFCLDEVSNFQEICQTVLTDNEIQQALKSLVPRTPQSEPVWSRLFRRLWPETNWLLRPAVAYIAILVLIYPAYLGFKEGAIQTYERHAPLQRIEAARLDQDTAGHEEQAAPDAQGWDYSQDQDTAGHEEHAALRCAFCGKIIDGEYISYSGESYHAQCGETLATIGVELAEQFFQFRTEPQVRPVQALVLTSRLRVGTRTPSLGADLVISFPLQGAEMDRNYTVTLEHEKTGVVFEDTAFTDIDRYDFSGRLYVPAELLKPGKYVLSVKGPGLGKGLSYPFEIDQ